MDHQSVVAIESLGTAYRLLPGSVFVWPGSRSRILRPGARQIFPHVISVPADASVIRVGARFYYREDWRSSHGAVRVFAVPRFDAPPARRL